MKPKHLVMIGLVLVFTFTSCVTVNTPAPPRLTETPFPTLFPSPTPTASSTPKPEQMVTVGEWKALTLRNTVTNATLLIERTEWVDGNAYEITALDVWVTWNTGRIRTSFKIDQSSTIPDLEGVRIVARESGELKVYYTAEWQVLSVEDW